MKGVLNCAFFFKKIKYWWFRTWNKNSFILMNYFIKIREIILVDSIDYYWSRVHFISRWCNPPRFNWNYWIIDKKFPDVNWPQKSSDLMQMENLIWGYVKNKFYKNKSKLTDKIIHVLCEIQPQLCQNHSELWQKSRRL